MDLSTILPLAGALLAFLAVAAVGYALVGDSPSAGKATKRLGAFSVDKRSDNSRARQIVESQTNRRKQILQTLKAQEKQQRKVKLTLESRLIQAGLAITTRQFWIASGSLGGVAFLVPLIMRANFFVAVGIGVIAGVGLPRWVLTVLAGGRAKKFTEEFPNAIDAIVRGIKSGLPVHDCLKLIAQESPEPLATEFRKLLENISMGLSTDSALEKMYARMPTSEVRFFSIVLAIQQRTGGNLAEALNNLTVVLRSRKLLREKIKALSGEAVASAMIIGSLPPGIMMLVTATTPGYMLPLIQDDRGHIILLAGATMEAFGIFVMRRMINFKF